MPERLHSFEQLLSDKLLEVADYQRPYAWEEKQLGDLWEDLDLLGSNDHYAGTVVLQDTQNRITTRNGKHLDVFEVVDGQQRLTTCIILLDRLRREMERLDSPELQDLDFTDAVREVNQVIWVRLIGGQSRSRLRLGAELADFFENSILGDDAPDSTHLLEGERRLVEAARYFDDRIRSLIDQVPRLESAGRLLELRARVCFKLQFLLYDVKSSAEVGVLFETLNDRGQSLSELEKVKNYLLYLARQIPPNMGTDLAGKVNRAWSDIFKHMAAAGVDDDALLRAHWIVTEDPVIRNWRRTASVKAKFPRSRFVPASGTLAAGLHDSARTSEENLEALRDEVVEYVDTLRKCSAFIRDLHSSESSYPNFDPLIVPEIRAASRALDRTGSVANFRPLLLAARLRYPTDGRLYLRLLRLCETFSARAYVICVLRSNAGQSTLTWSGHNLAHNVDAGAIIDGITAHLWRLAPDSAVRANFGPEIDWYFRRGHKYVLYEYELSVTRGEMPALADLTNGASKTTEHVLPQHPAEGSQWWSDFSEFDHRRLVNTIGNLVLTRDNSAYSNRDYALKRGEIGQTVPRCYLSLGAFQRERDIAERWTEWTPQSIEERRGEIESWALSRWRVEPPTDQDNFDDENDEEDVGDGLAAD